MKTIIEDIYWAVGHLFLMILNFDKRCMIKIVTVGILIVFKGLYIGNLNIIFGGTLHTSLD